MGYRFTRPGQSRIALRRHSGSASRALCCEKKSIREAKMRSYRQVVLAAAAVAAALLVRAGAAPAKSSNYGALTCGDFLAAGQPSMAVIIWWLRGYHAGKSGTTTFNPSSDGYAGRLGFYCRNHSADNLLETSERIFDQLDRGI
jgi:hypothetical protein